MADRRFLRFGLAGFILLLLGGVFVTAGWKKRPGDPRPNVQLTLSTAVADSAPSSRESSNSPDILRASDPAMRGSDPDPRENERATLRRRLRAFRDWWGPILAEGRRDMDRSQLEEFLARSTREQKEHLDGLAELILICPEEFIDFLKEPGNDFCYSRLLGVLENVVEHDERLHEQLRQPFQVLPPALREGFLDLLKSGTPVQKSAILEFCNALDYPPEEFRQAYLSMLNDSDLSVRRRGLDVVLDSDVVIPAEMFPRLREIADDGLTGAVVHAMVRSSGLPAETYLLDRLERETDRWLAMDLAEAAGVLARRNTSSVGAVARALGAAIMMHGNDEATLEYVAKAAIELPPTLSLPLLEQSVRRAGSMELRGVLEEILTRIRAGETSADALRPRFDSR